MRARPIGLIVIACVVACGRRGFDPLIDGDGKGDNSDATTILDGPLPDVTLATGCVTWSATVHGPAVGLQNDGFDVVSAGGGIGVAANGLSGNGRAYVEVEVVSTDNNAEVAIKDATTTNLDEFHVNTNGANAHYDNFEGELISKGSGWTVEIGRVQAEFDTGDTVMWALDHGAGMIWHGRNGTWFGNGNPALGTAPTFRASTSVGWFPSVYAEDGARFRIRGSTPDQQHTAPAGFASFATAVGLPDNDCILDPGE